VHRWYGQAYTTNQQDAEQRATRLLGAIDRSAATRELAGNPMLLTILAVIGRRRELPKERHRVFQHAVEVLTQYWDLNRAVRDTRVAMDYIDEEDKRELLRRVARRMQEGEHGIAGNRLTRPELLTEFEAYLRERYQKPPDEARIVAKAMLEQFRDRNFILSRFGPGLYGFVHRALLEYCCADDIVYRLNNEQTLTPAGLVNDVFGVHAEDPAWEEVLLLTAGMINERFLGPVVDDLLVRADTPAARLDASRGARLIVLALRCIGEARRLSQLERQCERLMHALIAQLTGIINEAIRSRWFTPSGMPELSGVPALMRDLGPAFPARETFRTWYRRTMIPGENIDAAIPLGELVGGIAAALFAGDRDEGTLLRRQLRNTAQWQTRLVALGALARGWPDDDTRTLLTGRATTDNDADVRQAAVQALAQRWPDDDTRTWLTNRATTDNNWDVRQAAVQALAQHWPDNDTRTWLTNRATTDNNGPSGRRQYRRSRSTGPTTTPAPGSQTAPPPTTTTMSGRRQYRRSRSTGPTTTPAPGSPTTPPPTITRMSGGRQCRRWPSAGPTTTPARCSPTAPPPTATRMSGRRRYRPWSGAGPTTRSTTLDDLVARGRSGQ
jgi:hypothetical protein